MLVCVHKFQVYVHIKMTKKGLDRPSFSCYRTDPLILSYTSTTMANFFMRVELSVLRDEMLLGLETLRSKLSL